MPEYLSWRSLWGILFLTATVTLSFLVYIPYSVPFFLHYLEYILHAFTPQTFIIYLCLQNSDSVTLLRAGTQTLKIYVADTGVHPKNKEDTLPSWRQADALQQFAGILNREVRRWVCEFQTRLLPCVFCIILNKIIKPPPPPTQKPTIAFSCHSWFAFQWHRYSPSSCQCVPKSAPGIGFQTEACPHAYEQDFSAQMHKATSRRSS